jgi:hypothetical protein
LIRLLPGHDVTTVTEAGWAGMKNGELLERASEAYEAFLTIDANMPYQQVLERFAIGIVMLKAPSNRLADLEPLVPDVLSELDGIQPGELRSVGA